MNEPYASVLRGCQKVLQSYFRTGCFFGDPIKARFWGIRQRRVFPQAVNLNTRNPNEVHHSLRAAILLLVAASSQTAAHPTVAEAEQFMTQAEARLNDLSVKANRAAWVQENFITDDTEAMSADAQDQGTAATTELVEQAKRFDGLTMPPACMLAGRK